MSTDWNFIVDNITHFYTNLYTEEVGWRPKLDGIEFSMIPQDEALWLERPFDEKEVGGFLMWSLWRERNNRTFEDVELSTTKLIESCMCSLFEWSRVWGFSTSSSVGGFLDVLSQSNML